MAAWRDLANYDDLGAARYRHRRDKKRGDDQLNNPQTRMVRADQEHALFVAAFLDSHRFRPAGRRRPVGYESLPAAALVDRRNQGNQTAEGVRNIAEKSS
jgi:hypothetical protein